MPLPLLQSDGTLVACAICGSRETRHLYEKSGYGIAASGPSPTAYCCQARDLRGWREEPADVGHGSMMGHVGTVVAAVAAPHIL